MIELPEQIKKLPIQERRDCLKALAETKTGQALREELMDIMNDIGNVNKLAEYLFENDAILSSEVRGMKRARAYLQGVYNLLIPEEKHETKKKSFK